MNCNTLIMAKRYRVIIHYVWVVKLTIFSSGEWKGGRSPEKITFIGGGVMQLSNDTSKNSTSPPNLVKNERSLTRRQFTLVPLL